MRRAILAVAALAALAGAAQADEVVLRNGQKLVGIAREEGDKIMVELPLGTVGFAKADVVSITPGRTILHEYRDKADAIKESKDAKDYLALAKWARESGLKRYEAANLEAALRIDPNNESAHRALGHVFHKGKWMSDEDVRKEQGYIWFEGRWMTAMEQQLVIRKRLDAEAAKLAAVEEKRRKKETERLARAQAMQDYYDDLIERERMRRTQPRAPRWRGYGYGPYRGAYWGDAVATFDVVGYLRAIGWSFVPVVPGPGFPAP